MKERPLDEAEPGNGGASKKLIDSLDQPTRLVAQEQRRRWRRLESQSATLIAGRELQGPGDLRNLAARDRLPMKKQRRFREARAGKGGSRRRMGIGRKRAGPIAPLGTIRRCRLRHSCCSQTILTMPRVQPEKKSGAAQRLLCWYDVHRRSLPWRALKGAKADPYQVWLSEIMLQQTTVATVGRYYRKFLENWPSVGALAAASLDDVLAAWAGLGYYARARNLHKTARVVAQEFEGRFPESAEALRRLPGIGNYTAAAIAAIAFDAREAAMDGNAERVIARYFAVTEPLPAAKAHLYALQKALVPGKRAGDFAQALMDLGATICTPRAPVCSLCPWSEHCSAHRQRIEASLPVKAGERVRPLKRGAAFVVCDAQGAVLLRRRAEDGLLGGMLEPPLGPWTDAFPTRARAMKSAPFAAVWRKRVGLVRHGFTHFLLEIEVYAATIPERPPVPAGYCWIAREGLASAALPTLMKKIIAHGFDTRAPQPKPVIAPPRYARSARNR